MPLGSRKCFTTTLVSRRRLFQSVESRRKTSPVNSPASPRPLYDVETHGEFSYIEPACCVSFRRKFTGWNAHALKGTRMFSGRRLLALCLGLSLCLTTLAATAAGLLRPAIDFPLPVDSYHDQQIPSLFAKLTGRIQREPLNLVATIIFVAAIVHSFLTTKFRKIAHRYQQSYEAIEYLLHATDKASDEGVGFRR